MPSRRGYTPSRRGGPMCPPYASRIRHRPGRVLLEIEHAAGDALALIGCEVGGGAGHVVRREHPAERPRRDRLRDPFVALAFLLALDLPFPFGERPPDVDLVHANPV